MKNIFLFLALITHLSLPAATVTNLHCTYKHGQAFLTWTNVSDTTAFYKVYRSTTSIIAGSQLAACEYLGYTDSHSSRDWSLTMADGVVRTIRMDSAGVPLPATTGLFVATTLADGNYYYAVTAMIDGAEDQTIICGSNATSVFIAETVSTPMPVFQEYRIVDGDTAWIYGTFLSTKYAAGQPLMNKTGCLMFDFAVYKNHGSGLHPLCVRLHPGGATFLDKVTNADEDEMILSMEDNLPNGTNQAWFGVNENFDIYNADSSDVPPTTGVNYNHTQLRINQALDFVFSHFAIDTNRVYIKGTSLGAPGAFMMALAYPDRFAAIHVDGGLFSLAEDSDYQSNCSFNTGKKNRQDGDVRMGFITTDLLCNSGYGTYEILNGGWVIHQFNERNFPFIFSLNGKRDDMTGWTEKTYYYDSVNHNHVGGWYFWDNRDHSGDGGTWNANKVADIWRFRKDLSFPAITDCSLNEDWGNGDGITGSDHGTVNAAVNWVNEVVDDSAQWQVKLFIQNLPTKTDSVIYADSCTATVTPRRIQHFNPSPGDSIAWSVTHNNGVIQSGIILYTGGLITVTGIKVFKDTATFSLNYQTIPTLWHADIDEDGYGNPTVYLSSITQPIGYVSDHNDCNDANAFVHPTATEMCNGLDDNCNGQADEGLLSIFYADSDIDGFGNAITSVFACSEPIGFVNDNTDCDDANSNIYPGASEVCNNLDDNCNNQIDEGVQLTFYSDSDQDGYGNALNTTLACVPPSGFVSDNTDCDDTNSSVYPGAPEIANNGVDEDCNGIDLIATYTGGFSLQHSPDVFPNPTTGKFTVEFISDQKEVRVQVLNFLGEKIFDESATIPNGKLRMEIIPDQPIANGLYVVKIITGEREFSTSLVVEKGN